MADLGSLVLSVKTGSGTYTPTTDMLHVIGIAVGGGGSGAGGINTDSAGGGGGGGGLVIRLLTAAQIGASKSFAVGAAGNATTLDTAGALMNAGAGGTGTAGAQSAALGASAVGGTGGTASNGDLNVPGQNGGLGVTFSGTDGHGGPGGSALGFGAGPAGTNLAGTTGTAYGGGGSGGHASATANRDGGAGAAGTLLLLEFIQATAPTVVDLTGIAAASGGGSILADLAVALSGAAVLPAGGTLTPAFVADVGARTLEDYARLRSEMSVGGIGMG